MEDREIFSAFAPDDAEFLENVCVNCGFTVADIESVGLIKEIEITLNDYRTMRPIGFFSNLRSLSISANNLTAIEGLESMVQLEELWLVENQIENISGLENSTRLQRLNLSSNRLYKIDGIEQLTQLKSLWLCENEIDSLQNLTTLTQLTQLWIAGNRIEAIGASLDTLQQLTDLNISANNIGSFREILNLSRLSSLKTLYLYDPHYGENPVCSLCNYQTYVLYHLGRLQFLDTLKISEDAKIAAETTFMKKRMYYNMRIKTIQRSVSHLVSQICAYKNDKIQHIYQMISDLKRQVNLVSREIDERTKLPPALPDSPSTFTFDEAPLNPLDEIEPNTLVECLQANLETLVSSMTEKIAAAEHLDSTFHHIQNKIHSLSEQTVHKLITELETGGNIRYEEGKDTDNWYRSCVSLVEARFHAQQYAKYGIRQVHVTKITRIHNRFLRNRFEQRLEQVADTSNTAYKKQLEYLFYGVDPAAPHEIFHNIEEGFRSPAENISLANPECSVLCNSLELADLARIKSFTAQRAKGSAEVGLDIPTGRLLVCKTYIGGSTPDKTRMLYYPDMTISEIWDCDPIAFESYGNHLHRTRSDDDKQKLWFITDNTLIQPEYLVEFEYTGASIPVMSGLIEEQLHLQAADFERAELRSVIQSVEWYAGLCKRTVETHSANLPTVMEPNIPKRSTVDCITPAVITELARSTDLSRITYLNLAFNQLEAISGLDELVGLTHLILAHNLVTIVGGIDECVNLVTLDISFNCVKGLQSLENNEKLESLDLYDNKVSSASIVQQLSMECMQLKELNLAANPLAQQPRHRMKVIQALSNLQILDGKIVSEEEQAEVLQYGNQLITKEMIRENCSVGNKSSKCQLLGTSSGAYRQPSPSITQAFGEDWEQSVEILELTHKKITSLHGIQNLFNLRKAFFMDNDIEAIAGLHNCRLLEELSLENNQIAKIEGISHLIYLKKLDLGKNQIRVIENLGSLEYLTQLSLEDNFIDSLEGLVSLRNLMELYIGNNRLENQQEIQVLSSHPKLIILDISGNPFCEAPMIRQFTVFNLTKLKVLDGVGIEPSERNSAKSQYSGRLTNDILEKRLRGVSVADVQVLDLSRAKLKDFDDMFNASTFPALIELNLSENNIMSFRCFGEHPRLKAVHLAKNQIDSFFPHNSDVTKGLGGLAGLEMIDLSSNLLQDFNGLHAYNLNALQSLRVTNNQITKVDFLYNLPQLRELDARSNKIREISISAFGVRCPLRVLRLDDNFLRSFQGINKLIQLQVLHAANNRIGEIFEIEKLSEMQYLQELVLKANPMARKAQYRISVIKRMPCLMYLDDAEVTFEERDRLEFAGTNDTKAPPLVHLQQANAKLPVRLTAMNFDHVLPAQSGDRAVQMRPQSTVNSSSLGVHGMSNQKQRPPKTKGGADARPGPLNGIGADHTTAKRKSSSSSPKTITTPHYRRP